MKVEALLHFYRQRFRTHPAQELLAGAGIAIGVALVFAVIVANTSITTSASQISRGIAGQARLQLGARGEQGFDAGILSVVRSLPSVEHASGIFEQRAILQGTRRTTGVATDRSGREPGAARRSAHAELRVAAKRLDLPRRPARAERSRAQRRARRGRSPGRTAR